MTSSEFGKWRYDYESKKCIGVIMSLVMAMALCACGGGNASSGKSIYDHGLDVISLMTEAAGSELYVATHSMCLLLMLESVVNSRKIGIIYPIGIAMYL